MLFSRSWGIFISTFPRQLYLWCQYYFCSCNYTDVSNRQELPSLKQIKNCFINFDTRINAEIGQWKLFWISSKNFGYSVEVWKVNYFKKAGVSVDLSSEIMDASGLLPFSLLICLHTQIWILVAAYNITHLLDYKCCKKSVLRLIL